MLVLFETAAGFALFKVLDEGKLKHADDLWQEFETPGKARKVVALNSFFKFESTTDALASATALVESKVSKDLSKFLKKNIVSAELKDTLAVTDQKLAVAIKEALGIKCLYDNSVAELTRGIRLQMSNLIEGMAEADVKAMALGLSHSLSRYKLKFSPDKVDTMIVQAISLLDDMDKELNIYAMRVREWYGWHFPELGRIITDNLQYARLVRLMGLRANALKVNLEEVLPEETIGLVKEASQMSMGTELSQEDIDHVSELCKQVIDISVYREELDSYLKTRMLAIAPNLTEMVGELLGARLIARAGSLMNLAKYPASTVQILGAEKALFRALKTKQATPKYGILFQASFIGQANAKNKGKISRVLAAKTSLAVRVDALGETEHVTIGLTARAAVERRLRVLESGSTFKASAAAKKSPQTPKYDSKRNTEAPALQQERAGYDTKQDVIMTQPHESAKKATQKEKEVKKEVEQEAKSEPSDSSDSDSSSSESEDEKKKKEKKKEKKLAKQAKKLEKKKKREEKKRARDDDKDKKKKKKAKKESSSSSSSSSDSD